MNSSLQSRLLFRTIAVTALAAPLWAGTLWAATPADLGDPTSESAPRAPQASSEVYVVASGGVGDEERNAIESQSGRYSMRMIFSESNGQYVVADRVVMTKRGTEVLRVNDAGPLVYAQVPPGQYALNVTYKGVTQTRNVTVGARASDMHMTWPVELD